MLLFTPCCVWVTPERNCRLCLLFRIGKPAGPFYSGSWYSPHGCMLQVFFLLFCYLLTLSFCNLVGNLYKGRLRGWFLAFFYSVWFLLDLKIIAGNFNIKKNECNWCNVLICWIKLWTSRHGKHNLGYDLLLLKISFLYVWVFSFLAVFAINWIKIYLWI